MIRMKTASQKYFHEAVFSLFCPKNVGLNRLGNSSPGQTFLCHLQEFSEDHSPMQVTTGYVFISLISNCVLVLSSFIRISRVFEFRRLTDPADISCSTDLNSSDDFPEKASVRNANAPPVTDAASDVLSISP